MQQAGKNGPRTEQTLLVNLKIYNSGMCSDGTVTLGNLLEVSSNDEKMKIEIETLPHKVDGSFKCYCLRDKTSVQISSVMYMYFTFSMFT